MTQRVRTDIIDAYVFRRKPGGAGEGRGTRVEVLQLFRARGPVPSTWQPVMGHIEAGERATDTLWRELSEELGLDPRGPQMVDAWALEQVHPFFVAELDAIVLSPRFAVEVVPGFEPSINDEHDDFRWLTLETAVREALWPGQRAALKELSGMLAGDPSAELLRLGAPGSDPSPRDLRA